MRRVIGAWIGGENPGPMLVEVDPGLEPCDMEIALDGLVDEEEHDEIVFGRVMTPTSPIDKATLDALLAHMGGNK
jgi:hypothetical protein